MERKYLFILIFVVLCGSEHVRKTKGRYFDIGINILIIIKYNVHDSFCILQLRILIV